MAKRTARMITPSELIEELQTSFKDFALLMITTDDGTRTVYVAPDKERFKKKLGVALERGEFRDCTDAMMEALSEDEGEGEE